MDSDESAWLHGIVAKLAHQLWEERGHPLGSPEQDWFRAEQVVRHHLGLTSSDRRSFPPLPAVFLEPREERGLVS